jgi:acyl carrier protein
LLQEEYVAPQNEIESKLADIWIGVLGLDRIGVQDNFFALGGHSLLASQVATRIRDTFDLEFPLSRIFEAPTISELAVVVQNLVVERASKTKQPDPLNDARVRNLIDNIDELSEQEIEALLIEYQKKPEARS